MNKLIVSFGEWLVATFGSIRGATYTVIPGRVKRDYSYRSLPHAERCKIAWDNMESRIAHCKKYNIYPYGE